MVGVCICSEKVFIVKWEKKKSYVATTTRRMFGLVKVRHSNLNVPAVKDGGGSKFFKFISKQQLHDWNAGCSNRTMIPNTHCCSFDWALGFYTAEKKKDCLLILTFDSAFGSFSHTIMTLLKCLEELLYWEPLNTIGNPRNNLRSFQDPVKPMEHLQIWQLLTSFQGSLTALLCLYMQPLLEPAQCI